MLNQTYFLSVVYAYRTHIPYIVNWCQSIWLLDILLGVEKQHTKQNNSKETYDKKHVSDCCLQILNINKHEGFVVDSKVIYGS